MRQLVWPVAVLLSLQKNGRGLGEVVVSEATTVTAFVYGEIELAGGSGIHVSKFGQARKKLRQGVDWDLNNLRVAYSAAGMEAVLAAVLPAPPAPLAPELQQVLTELATLDKPTATSEKKAGEVEGTVTRRGGPGREFINPYLLELEVAGGTSAAPKKVIVKVRNTDNFRRGMKCPLRWSDQTNSYELARRMPRFPGKW